MSPTDKISYRESFRQNNRPPLNPSLKFSSNVPPVLTKHSQALADLNRIMSVPSRKSLKHVSKEFKRIIPNSAEMVLDAPNARDDYYCSLLDWASSGDLLVGLANQSFLWNKNGTLQLVHETNDIDHISTVAFSPTPKNCGIGTEAGSLLVYDVSTNNLLHDFEDQDGVSALIWKSSTEMVTGDPDGNIVHWDIRTSRNRILQGHHLDRVVGIAKSVDNVIATGCNGNIVNIWDDRRLDKPRLVINSHTSAVRALAWCPWSAHILATGGGLDDGTIQIHNTVTGKLLQKYESGDQVCQMLWSLHYKEIISAHNCQSKQLRIYKFPEMKLIHTLPGHNVRPMHLALSPDGQTVASIGDDETLKVIVFNAVLEVL
ncbi:ubiquitin-protein transferase activating protein [Boothiomyces macroporosus]|uniref:Ubiquitin-protein transferase activating protein n=1 Tax=Boothiomyces macroporosus TaxID=261099 RepID=A0AAD5Y5J4_9FUNG|nr:ubiquitin-protein transferase activating protein [Boothiomyces macroporosus]